MISNPDWILEAHKMMSAPGKRKFHGAEYRPSVSTKLNAHPIFVEGKSWVKIPVATSEGSKWTVAWDEMDIDRHKPR